MANINKGYDARYELRLPSKNKAKIKSIAKTGMRDWINEAIREKLERGEG